MEGFLIFLAIIAIQMIAAYAKQKKAAAAKRQQPQPQPVEFEMPTWSEEVAEEDEDDEEIEERAEEPEIRQVKLPAVELAEVPVFVQPKVHKHKFKVGNVKQGIIWAAILQEPRYKAKWKPVCSR